MTYEISDGRSIEVEPIGGDVCCAKSWGILMYHPNGDVTGICVMNATPLAVAEREAEKIAHGIQFDLDWMARR